MPSSPARGEDTNVELLKRYLFEIDISTNGVSSGVGDDNPPVSTHILENSKKNEKIESAFKKD